MNLQISCFSYLVNSATQYLNPTFMGMLNSNMKRKLKSDDPFRSYVRNQQINGKSAENLKFLAKSFKNIFDGQHT